MLSCLLVCTQLLDLGGPQYVWSHLDHITPDIQFINLPLDEVNSAERNEHRLPDSPFTSASGASEVRTSFPETYALILCEAKIRSLSELDERSVKALNFSDTRVELNRVTRCVVDMEGVVQSQ